MAFKISEVGIKQIASLFEEQHDEKETCSAVSQIISNEWAAIYTVPPKHAFIVGLCLLGAIFGIELLFSKDNINNTTYQYLVVLASSLTATSFCAGFTGALNINLKWLQSSGAIAIFVLVFLENPFFGRDGVKVEPESSTQVKRPVVFSSAYAGQNEQLLEPSVNQTILKEIPQDQAPHNPLVVELKIPEEQLKKAKTSEKPAIGYTRVYYPIGVTDLKKIAFQISKSSQDVSTKSEVYSYGSVFAAVTNPLIYTAEQFDLQVKYRPSMTETELALLLSQLKTEGFNLDKAQLKPDYTEADISIYLKIK